MNDRNNKTWDKMSEQEKKEFYRQVKLRAAQDGKSHQSIRTKNGVYVDDKKYTPRKSR